MRQSLFFDKVAGLRPATLLKKRLWHRCSPVNFVKFLRTPSLKNNSGGCFYISVSLKRVYTSLDYEHVFCENIKYSQKNTCHGVPFFKVAVIGLKLYYKSKSIANVYL